MESVYDLALEEARKNGLDEVSAKDYAETVDRLSAGSDPFRDDAQYRAWQKEHEALGLEGWPS